MLLDAQKYSQKLAYLPMLLVGCLLVFFIGSNYYNFLLQTIAQHSLRRAEAELIGEVSASPRSGKSYSDSQNQK
jgi:hypothetical protein